MARAKKTTLFVIYARPEQLSGPNEYIARDGTITSVMSQVARFYSHRDAEEFAKEKGIALTATCYIGRADFTEFDMQHG
jgi:hypothetical protein